MTTISKTRWCKSDKLQHTVELVIFARFQFSRISRGGQIREFKNPAKNIFIFALLNELENSKIRNLRKFKHAKNTRSTVLRIKNAV